MTKNELIKENQRLNECIANLEACIAEPMAIFDLELPDIVFEELPEIDFELSDIDFEIPDLDLKLELDD